MKKASVWLNLKRYRYVYLMLAIVLVWYIAFAYAPMFGLIMSFEKFSFAKGFFGSELVGLNNFKMLFSDRYFVQAFKNTFAISFLRIVFEFPIPIIFAFMINEVRSKPFRSVIQNITYFPHFFNWIVFGGLIGSVLALDRGVVNGIIQLFGGSQIDFLGDSRYFRTILIVTNLLKEVGWNSIIYIAAIQGINPTLYESADLDGVNRWQKIRYISLPGIAPTISIMFILFVGGVFTQGFDQVYNLYSPVVYDKGDILSTYIVRTLKEVPNLGVQAAAGFINSVISMLFLLVSNWVVRLMGQESIY